MNTFHIYQYNSIIFSKVCSSPPSLEEKNTILAVLEKCRFLSLRYNIDVIYGDSHKRLTGVFHYADKFIEYLLDLCEEGIKYGVELYLN